MNFFQRTLIRRILRRHAVSAAIWRQTVDGLNLFQGLSSVDKAHLREFCTLFLHEKNLVAAQGLDLTDAMRLTIAAFASLPVLHLGFQCLSGWTDVVVYPGAFRVSRDAVDAAGVVHRQEQVLSGESWSRGPLIISWADVARECREVRAGRNVVIHEIAHKLDVLNGSCNGYPPLHHTMSIPDWTETMAAAYGSLCRELEEGLYTRIDAYAATSPAEFFAVASEYFFCAPQLLQSCYGEVFRQLELYYRQHPLLRQQASQP